MVKISIVIPAYNEEERIESTLLDYLGFFDNAMKSDYEIIVIPNNCSDGTVDIVARLLKKHKSIKSKEFKYYTGKSGALIEGFKLAQGDLIGFTDADNSASPRSFFKLVEGMEGFDGAIGSRWVKDAEIELKQPFMRRVFSRSFNFLVRFLLGLNYYDTQCGAKVFRGDKLKKIIPFLGKTLWAFDMDLLYQLKREKAMIVEVPIHWKDDSRTTLNLKKASFQMFLSLVRLRLMYSPFRFLVQFYDKLPESFKIHH